MSGLWYGLEWFGMGWSESLLLEEDWIGGVANWVKRRGIKRM